MRFRRRKKSKPEQVGQFLESFLAKKGWRHKVKEYQIWTQWEDLVGPKLATRCSPLRLRYKHLIIVVENHTWLTQLQFLQDDLKRRIAEKLKVHLEKITFSVDPAKVKTSIR